MLGGLVGRYTQAPVANQDLLVACDRSRSKDVRALAWEKYEVECWYRAFKQRGLLIRNMDNERTGIHRVSMQWLVTERMRLPELSGTHSG
jgi:hypothetical protein